MAHIIMCGEVIMMKLVIEKKVSSNISKLLYKVEEVPKLFVVGLLSLYYESHLLHFVILPYVVYLIASLLINEEPFLLSHNYIASLVGFYGWLCQKLLLNRGRLWWSKVYFYLIYCELCW